MYERERDMSGNSVNGVTACFEVVGVNFFRVYVTEDLFSESLFYTKLVA